MALRRVDLSTDVYFVCLNHAMCTEGEEIVGLLVGEVDEERIAHVVAVLILRRSDKRKDRVEISPEQLSNASTEAEKLACILKRPVRVVGWYHSHPKLTVYPSLVDVCTQESYQLMDEGFIGMIFSVFNTDPNKFGGRIQMICYQSQTVIIDCNVEKSHVEIPIQLVPSKNISDVCMNSVVQLPRFLCQEEQLAYQMANQVPLDYLTRLHNSSVYLRKMGQIAEVICGPLLKMLEERILNNEMKRKQLQERKKALTVLVEKARTEKVRRQQEKAKKELELRKAKEILRKQQLQNQESKQKIIKDSKTDVKQSETRNKTATQHSLKSTAKSDRSPIGDQEVPHFKDSGHIPVEDISLQTISGDKSLKNDPQKQKQLKAEEAKPLEKASKKSTTLSSKSDHEISSKVSSKEVASKDTEAMSKSCSSKDSSCNNLSDQKSNVERHLLPSGANVNAQSGTSHKAPVSSPESSKTKISSRKNPSNQTNI